MLTTIGHGNKFDVGDEGVRRIMMTASFLVRMMEDW